MAERVDAGRVPDGYVPVHISATAPPEGNGCDLFHSKNAGVYTQEAVKASPATLYGLWVDNNQAAIVHVQLFNKLTADVTPGTTVPDFEVAVPASVGKEITLPAAGINFSIGIVAFLSTASHGGTGSNAGVSLTLAYK